MECLGAGYVGDERFTREPGGDNDLIFDDVVGYPLSFICLLRVECPVTCLVVVDALVTLVLNRMNLPKRWRFVYLTM